ncbi:MAG: choice-of-anchor Q domain-containing protein [bacterium]|nr:choice-of-anchor Q domain-containing protein [bacterium]
MIRRFLSLFVLALVVGLFGFSGTQPAQAGSVVGDGTPASCTSAALQTSINEGHSVITFNCGANPVTIPVTTTLQVSMQTATINTNLTIDGDNKITLDGQNARRILFHNSWGYRASTLTLRDITLANGRVTGVGTAANGAAIQSLNNSIDGNTYDNILNLDNVTIRDNVASLTSSPTGDNYDFGGAVYILGGALNATNSTFSGNQSQSSSGSAIHVLQSGLVVTNTTFTNNVSTGQGGAIYIDGINPTNVVDINGSTFTGNRSYDSGGAIYVNMYNNADTFVVRNSTFTNNGVNGGTRAQGGAICGGTTNGNAQIYILNSLFSNNFVDLPGDADGSGGALNFNQRAVVTIANSTFNGNRAEGMSYGANGGAIYIINNVNPFTILNSTITNNFAGWVGGGISSTSNGVLRNTIIAYNTADNGPNPWDISQQCSAELGHDGTNLQWPPRNPSPNYWNETTCFQGKSGVNQRTDPVFRDPLLAALANNGGPTQTRAPLPGSPAIDGGSNTTCAAWPISNIDQRGNTRPIDGNAWAGAQCDIGALELNDPAAHFPTAPQNTAFSDTNTLQPLMQWSLSGTGSNATQFRLVVFNKQQFDAGVYTPVFDAMNTRTQACGSPSGNNCQMRIAVNLVENVSYYGFVQGYSPAGFSVGGQFNNGWEGGPFRVDTLPDPAVPSGISVLLNQGRPTIRWNDDAQANRFFVAIYNWTANTWAYGAYHQKGSAGLTCSSGQCSLITDAMVFGNGSYSVFINAEGAGGVSQGGSFNNGYGGPTNPTNTTEGGDFVYSYARPDRPSNLSFTYSGGNANVSWTGVERASWYYVWIGTANATQTRHLQWYSSTVLNCQTGGTCSASIPLTLPAGTYYLGVQSAGPGGYSIGGIANNGFEVLMNEVIVP